MFGLKHFIDKKTSSQYEGLITLAKKSVVDMAVNNIQKVFSGSQDTGAGLVSGPPGTSQTHANRSSGTIIVIAVVVVSLVALVMIGFKCSGGSKKTKKPFNAPMNWQQISYRQNPTMEAESLQVRTKIEL